jgi:dienelactone hydrolase
MTDGIHSEAVSYHGGGKTLHGYLAMPQGAAGRKPGILVFPEWWGLNDYIRGRAQQLAALGYVVLAADVYGDGTTTEDANRAGLLMNGLFADMSATTARVRAAYDTLKARPDVDAARMGAMGYCLGGAMALHAARLGLDLRGVVSFHGSLNKTHGAKAGEVKAKVLVLHAADDAFASTQAVQSFRDEMKALGVDLRFVAYPGAQHAFTNPGSDAKAKKFGIPLAYNANADKASWEAMQAFWSEVL